MVVLVQYLKAISALIFRRTKYFLTSWTNRIDGTEIAFRNNFIGSCPTNRGKNGGGKFHPWGNISPWHKIVRNSQLECEKENCLWKTLLRAYLNGKIFLDIFAFFRVFFIYFTKKMAQTAQLAWEKAKDFSKYFLFRLVVKIRLKTTRKLFIRKIHC